MLLHCACRVLRDPDLVALRAMLACLADRRALFLASDEASYCTGGLYVADGGFMA